MTFFLLRPYTYTHLPKNSGTPSLWNLCFWNEQDFGNLQLKINLQSLPWIKDFMMNFRKRITKSKKRTSCFYGLSWEQRKQYKGNIDKKCMCIHCQNFISIEVAIQEFGGGGGGWGVGHSTPPWVKVWVKNILGGWGLRLKGFPWENFHGRYLRYLVSCKDFYIKTNPAVSTPINFQSSSTWFILVHSGVSLKWRNWLTISLAS